MPRPKCIHGDSAPRSPLGRCRLCKNARDGKRHQRLKIANPELARKREDYVNARKRVRAGTLKASEAPLWPVLGIRCVCTRPVPKPAATRYAMRGPMYCSEECRERDTYETCRRIIESMGRKR